MKRWSAEQKIAHSERMKKCHADGKHPGWAHKNQDPNRRTYPERWFVEVLKNDEVLSKLIVVEQFNVGRYFLDFAFLEQMIDVELDGCQHERPEVIEKDSKRNEFLIALGWKVYRISWSRLFKDPLPILADLKNFILTAEKVPYTIIRRHENLEISTLPRGEKIKLSNDKKYHLIKEQLLASNIDFSKFGWVEKAAKIVKISSSKINPWMKRHLPDFYETKCFKRNKASVAPIA